MSTVGGIDHVTLRCAPAQLAAVQRFYETVAGLVAGARPSFDFPGAWLYAGEVAVLHLAAVLGDASIAAGPDIGPQPSVRPAATGASGFVDHFALRATADLESVRARLAALGVPFAEAPVPGWPLHQIFVTDPLGVKLELNFALGEIRG